MIAITGKTKNTPRESMCSDAMRRCGKHRFLSVYSCRRFGLCLINQSLNDCQILLTNVNLHKRNAVNCRIYTIGFRTRLYPNTVVHAHICLDAWHETHQHFIRVCMYLLAMFVLLSSAVVHYCIWFMGTFAANHMAQISAETNHLTIAFKKSVKLISGSLILWIKSVRDFYMY